VHSPTFGTYQHVSAVAPHGWARLAINGRHRLVKLPLPYQTPGAVQELNLAPAGQSTPSQDLSLVIAVQVTDGEAGDKAWHRYRPEHRVSVKQVDLAFCARLGTPPSAHNHLKLTITIHVTCTYDLDRGLKIHVPQNDPIIAQDINLAIV